MMECFVVNEILLICDWDLSFTDKSRKTVESEYYKDEILMKKSAIDPLNNFLAKLTWDDIEEWAGAKIAARGQEYFRRKLVIDLGITDRGGILAWVDGSERYATSVTIEGGKLVSDCSCPFEFTCKHAVGLILTYLDKLNTGESVSKIDEIDPRLVLLEDGFFDGDQFDEEDEECRITDSASTSKSTRTRPFHDYLEEQPKSQLIKMIEEFAVEYPLIRQRLEDQCDFSKGKVVNIIKSIRKENIKLSQTPGWQNYWNKEGFTPDYSRVRKLLALLVDNGHADAVVGLGKEIMAAGEEQVEASHDEGETAAEITACLEIVFKALVQSTLPVVERMLWAIGAELNDQFGLSIGLKKFWEQEFAKKDWEELAQRLKDQLAGLIDSEPGDSLKHACYQRDYLSNWLVLALQKTGKFDEAVALCEREAEKNNNYTRLVRILIEQTRFREAKQWILKGIEKPQDPHSDTARKLREFHKQIFHLEKDFIGIAGLAAEEFFVHPSLYSYQELQNAAEQIALWKDIRANVHRFLETGELPWTKTEAKNSCPAWSLPETGLPKLAPRMKQTFPMIETLIDIAIAENIPEQVVLWLDRRQPDRFQERYYQPKNDQIAEAIVAVYPERAVEIWENIAEGFINITGASAYEEAAQYLRKVRHTLNQLNRKDEWENYLSKLKLVHKKKRRLMEILERFSDKPLVNIAVL